MILAKQRLKVRRETGGYVDGDYIRSFGVPFFVLASVQPVTPEMVEALPEAARTSAKFALFADDRQAPLLASEPGGKESDRIEFKGIQYRLNAIDDWTTHVGAIPHKAYVMVKVGQDEVV